MYFISFSFCRFLVSYHDIPLCFLYPSYYIYIFCPFKNKNKINTKVCLNVLHKVRLDWSVCNRPQDLKL